MNRPSMWCGMLAVMLVLPAGGRAGEIGFGELFHPVALETTPQGLAVGDLDGDGRADLAITHNGGAAPDSLVRVERGDGRGGFAPAGDLKVRKWPVGMAIGDLDGD